MVKRYDEFTGELSFCEDFENNNIRIPKILAISVQKKSQKPLSKTTSIILTIHTNPLFELFEI